MNSWTAAAWNYRQLPQPEAPVEPDPLFYDLLQYEWLRDQIEELSDLASEAEMRYQSLIFDGGEEWNCDWTLRRRHENQNRRRWFYLYLKCALNDSYSLNYRLGQMQECIAIVGESNFRLGIAPAPLEYWPEACHN